MTQRHPFLPVSFFVFELRLDVGVIVRIAGAWHVGNRLRLRHVGNKHHVGAQVDFLVDLAADERVRAFGDIIQSVFRNGLMLGSFQIYRTCAPTGSQNA